MSQPPIPPHAATPSPADLRQRTEAVLRHPRTRRVAVGVAVTTVLVGVLGGLALPRWLHGKVEAALSAELHRPVSIRSLSINPYALSATVEGIAVKDNDGSELFALERLYANVEAASVWHGGPVVRELAVTGPKLALKRLPDGKLNVSDIIDAFLAKPESPTPAFAVHNIVVTGGDFSLDDVLAGEKHALTAVDFRLPFVSSLPAQVETYVEPAFSAQLDGAPVALKGRSKPFAHSKESELVLDLDGFSLARLRPYLPAGLPAMPTQGQLFGDLHLQFAQGEGGPARFNLAGTVKVDDLRVDAGKQPLFGAREVAIDLSEVDLVKRLVKLRSLAIKAPETWLNRAADGRIAGLPAPAKAVAPAKGKVAAKPAKPAKAEAATKPWRVQLAEAHATDGKLHWLDQSVGTRPVKADVEGLQLKLRDLDTAPEKKGAKTALDLHARLNGDGELSVKGELLPQPLQGELQVAWQGIKLLPWQPYVLDKLNATLTQGQVSGSGKLKLDGDALAFTGEATVGDLALLDAADIQVLRWKSLFLGGLDVQLAPLALGVGEVALSDFQAKIDISKEGKLNLAQLVKPAPEAVPAKEGKPAAPASAPASSEPLPLKLGKITLQGGRVAFSDRFVKPGYSARLTDLSGRIGALTPAAGSAADLDLRGRVDGSAPLRVNGRVNPLSKPAFVDLKAEVRGFDLSPLSPYAAKYAGYNIEKGKLSLDVSYKLEKNQLQAENHLFLDQLTFGEKVDSPTATKLPVTLAVALLKNRNGEIDINLPIAGSLDDPQFSMGGIIVQVIVNLFVKAVTSPFALIGSMFGGGEELSNLEFAAGRAALSPASVKRLQGIAKALEERPALKLEITGRADSEADAEGYKRAVLERKVRGKKLAEQAKAGKDSGKEAEEVKVGTDEYAAYLKKAYDGESFPKPRNLIGLTKSLPVEEMEKLMLANTEVGENELRQLANRRAQQARDWLLGEGKVAPERVFLLAPKLSSGGKEAASGSRVEFSLR